MEIDSQPSYYVVLMTTKYDSIEEVKAKASEAMAAHISRSDKLHSEGKLLMAGAFRNRPGEPVTTMGVFHSREDAEELARGDPFVLIGMVSEWQIKEGTNILKR